MTFLGTSGAVPTPTRNPLGLYLRREGEGILLDAGEGIQRQMMRFSTGFSVDVVLLSHLHGDHFFGIPGLLETLDFNDRTDPLSLYLPAGTDRTFRRFVDAAVGETDFPLRIRPVDAGETIVRAEEYRVETVPVDHDARALGYALIEDERPGRFDREAALDLGVPEGPMFGELQAGASVELEDGTVVEPGQVLGPPRPGRTVVYSGDTRPTAGVLEAARGADLLVHEATFGDGLADRAQETGHSTARQAGRLADEAGVRHLALVHVSPRYAGRRDRLRREATEAFDGEVSVPADGDELEVPFPS